MNAKDSFVLAYRAVRLAHPTKGNRHVHPLHVENLVRHAAGAVLGRRLPEPARRFDYLEPSEYLRVKVHGNVLAAYRWLLRVREGDLSEVPRYVGSKGAAWFQMAFYRCQNGRRDLWDLTLGLQSKRRPDLTYRLWLELKAGTPGPVTEIFRMVKTGRATFEQAEAIVSGLHPRRPDAEEPVALADG